MNRKSEKQRFLVAVITIIVLSLYMVIMGITGSGGDGKENSKKDAEKAKVNKPVTITIGSAGDILIHSPFIESSTYRTDKGYDFNSCFRYIKDTYDSYTYMAENLETTLAPSGYSGYPLFKSPDRLADNMADNGVDLFLIANNHIYDNGKYGFARTQKVLAKKNYDYTGGRIHKEDKRYLIKNIKGIKVGFINYTYETERSGENRTLNGNVMDPVVAERLNSFDPQDLSEFNKDLNKQISLMRKDGAEFIIFYPHFGEEYHKSPVSYQVLVAKMACRAGVDALIGGHPHVVEPVDVIRDEKTGNVMFCAYSMGNQISNQRREYMDLKSGETEDGIIVGLEITKNKKGRVKLTDVDIKPVWTYKTANTEYFIMPCDTPKRTEKSTGISGISSSLAASYIRTYKIVGEGMKKAKKEFAEKKKPSEKTTVEK